tara:strand:+ start:3011 stop:3850 length:840 start_codon:yes stop_codon:yes gene_type:complete
MIDDKMNPQLGAIDNQTDMSSTSLDLPDNIQAILNMPLTQSPVMGNMGMQPTPPQTMSYQEGGMVQPAGIQPMGMPTNQPMNPEVMDMEVNRMMSENPEVVARMRAAIEAGLQSGELTMEELNMAIQLAKAVLQDPSMYPQIRQFAIQKGLATEQDLPMQYDEGLIVAILIASKALEADVRPLDRPMQDMKDGGQLKEVPEGNSGLSKLPEDVRNRMGYMQDGGVLKGPSHEQGGIPVKVAGVNAAEMEGGEYVIPKHIVKAKGTEFFDKMLASYEDKA